MKDGIQIHKLWTPWPGHCIDWETCSHSYKYKTCNKCDVIRNSVFIHCLDRCSLACIYSVRLLCKWHAHQISTITSRGLFFFSIPTQNTHQFNWGEQGGSLRWRNALGCECSIFWNELDVEQIGLRLISLGPEKNLDSNLTLASNVFWHMNLHDL